MFPNKAYKLNWTELNRIKSNWIETGSQGSGRDGNMTSDQFNHKSISNYISGPKWDLRSLLVNIWSVSSVSQLCLTLRNPMDCSTPGCPVHHQRTELTQTHVYWAGDAIQPSHPLSPPSPPTFNLSQHQGLYQWISSSHPVAKVIGVSASASVLPMNIQDWFPRIDWLDLLTVQGTLKSLLKECWRYIKRKTP